MQRRITSAKIGHGWLRRIFIAAALSSATAAAIAAPDYGKCQVSGQRGSVKLTTLVPGALSVTPILSTPGWWNGESLDTVKDGFEYCLAANMAYRAGLDRLILVNRSFQQLLTGQSKGFDIALSGVTITPEREKVVNFTTPYYESDQGILVKSGAKVDAHDLPKLRYAVQQASSAYGFITEKVKPAEPPKVFVTDVSMYAALAAGQVDAVVYDTENVLARAKNSNGAFKVVGRFNTNEAWGGLVNKSSPNLAAFNELIEEMKKDGTLDRLKAKYLTPELSVDPSKLPVLF